VAVDVSLDLPGGDPARVLQGAADEALVELVRGGSSAAFEALYDRHHRNLLTFCRHLLWSREEAEDALQHTFASAYRALTGSGERPNAVKPWLYTIARNRCLTMLRARRTRREADDEPAESVAVADGLADEVQRRSDLRDMLADLQRLPEDQRAALVLFELGDHSHAEIAAVLSVNREKVKALVFQAREGLSRARTARDTPCAEIRRHLASRTRAMPRRGVVRGHLDRCPACAAYDLEVRRQRAALAIALPVVPSLELKGSVLGPMLGGGATVAGGGAVIAGGAGAGGAGLGSSGAAAAGAGALGSGAAGVGVGGAATIATGTAAAGGAGALAAKAVVAKALTVVAVASAAVGTGGKAVPALHDIVKSPDPVVAAPLHIPGPQAGAGNTHPIRLPAAASMPVIPVLPVGTAPAGLTAGAPTTPATTPATPTATTATATDPTTPAGTTAGGTSTSSPATGGTAPATAAPAAAAPAEPTVDPTTGGTSAPASVAPDPAPPADPAPTAAPPAASSADPVPATTDPVAADPTSTAAPADTTTPPAGSTPVDPAVAALSADPSATDPCATTPAAPDPAASAANPDAAAVVAAAEAAAAIAAQTAADGGVTASQTAAADAAAAAACGTPDAAASDPAPADPSVASASTP
jgi:RNA polymerase sigma factor (sigma-70 family)